MIKKFFIAVFVVFALAGSGFSKKIKHNVNKTNHRKVSSVYNLNKSENYYEVRLSTTEVAEIVKMINQQPRIRGIHLTAWVGGSKKLREEMIEKIKNSVINTVVVAVKEKNGEVYIPAEKSIKLKTYVPAIADPQSLVRDFKKINLYTIARVVCFHDNILPKREIDLAVKSKDGGVWKSRKGDMWVDPYNRAVWDYIIDVAEVAAKSGFDEIQFDYVRYPTEGDVRKCVFSEVHNRENATKNISDFIKYAKKRLARYNVRVSVDVFGLTTNSDMGIGQDLKMITEVADRVYPMMYPSHYYSGEYNLDVPEAHPYKVINRGLKQAMNNLGLNYYKIVPYLQDFSLKIKYTSFDVRAQIIAAKINHIPDFILWNPSAKYSWDLLKPEVFCSFIEPEKCKN